MDCTSRSSCSARNLRPREMQGIARYLERGLLLHPIPGHKQVTQLDLAPVQFVYRCKKVPFLPRPLGYSPVDRPTCRQLCASSCRAQATGSRGRNGKRAPGNWKERSWDIWITTT